MVREELSRRSCAGRLLSWQGYQIQFKCEHDELYKYYIVISSQRVHELLGYDGQLFGDLDIKSYDEETRSHKGLVYDPAKQTGTWSKSDLKQGQKLREPQPLYTKLEPEVVDEEKARLGQPYEEKPIEL